MMNRWRDEDKLTAMQAREYLNIPLQELLSYDKLISYTMTGLLRYYKFKDLKVLKQKIEEFKSGETIYTTATK